MIKLPQDNLNALSEYEKIENLLDKLDVKKKDF